ncbi:hypothetical protein NEUTE1DRAFT_135718 [Neurospora tetrasperma FGSC 2508]|uniref:Uncharacterized protein n=1 Tax=Neurospora tetrasperma (strain FGSC 2508 / ATCC MYA-4615 / P0657) TaxID=510951 RepID=F8MGE2_NEUT8|nr:uncharacterized protein NEUTE1DRAFT_135718 [Neurospora tetrasperma FGSC 2508]EGO58617.1 hypothetical protein NEUTE1DRAFT_135718 [Neurospora tetrasperma FGSC 2508]
MAMANVERLSYGVPNPCPNQAATGQQASGNQLQRNRQELDSDAYERSQVNDDFAYLEAGLFEQSSFGHPGASSFNNAARTEVLSQHSDSEQLEHMSRGNLDIDVPSLDDQAFDGLTGANMAHASSDGLFDNATVQQGHPAAGAGQIIRPHIGVAPVSRVRVY